jgi:predicted Na+-dependent transporter
MASTQVLPKIRSFVAKNSFPIALLCSILIGVCWPAPGLLVGQTPANTISIVGVFFITGLQLQTSQVVTALRAWPALAFGICSILAFSPALSLPIALLNLGPLEFSRGLALFLAM